MKDMNRTENGFDALAAGHADHGESLTSVPWDEVLEAVRRGPQLSAADAGALAQQRFADPALSLAKTSAAASSLGSPPPGADSAPTWDGQRSVMDIVRGSGLVISGLPETRSPTVMLGRIFFELGLIFTGHRGAHPELGIASASAVDRDGVSDLAAGPDARISSRARFEAECVTWLIAGRIGLRIAANGSLKGYLKYGELMPCVSKERVLSAVDMIEDLFAGPQKLSEMVREDCPSLFSVSPQLF